MWIKAQNGKLHSNEQFRTYEHEIKYGVVHQLIGCTRDNQTVVLLKYSSFEEHNFIDVAMRRIENGIINGQRLVDLTGICELDYTSQELGIA